MVASHVVSTSDGRELGYCLWGPPDGSPVFVLPGTPLGRYYHHAAGVYQRPSARAITYDRPGYGLSTRLAGRTVAQCAADVATIADHLGLDRFAVMGLSGGGPSALAAAAAMPHRVTRCATQVGVAPFDAEDLDFFEGMSAEEREEWTCAQQGEQCLAGQFYRDTLDWMQSLATSEEIPEPQRSVLVQAIREAVRTPWGMVDDYASFLAPWGFDLTDVRCPTRVWIADEDTSVPPAHGHWLVAHLTDAVAVVVHGGHLSEPAGTIELLVGWLAGADIPIPT